MTDDALPRAATGGLSLPEQVVWRHASSAAYVESAERVVVVDLDHLDQPPYVFEGTAAQIWACLDGEQSETEIVDELAALYAVRAEVITGDVRQFIDRLRELELIIAESGPPARA